MTFRNHKYAARVCTTLGAAVAALALLGQTVGPRLTAQCGPNPIVCENLQAGNPSSEWDISGAGDSTLQGFATDISVNKGDTVRLKVKTTAARFNIDIYRLGYYVNGAGARKIVSFTNITGSNQTATPCVTDNATHLVDCGAWTESASWLVPATAVSGIYF